MRIAAHGIELELPPGWEGRIYRRPGAWPVVHAASFALVAGDGDFATRAAERMPPGAVLLALVEYAPDLAGTALFAEHGPPRSIPASSASPSAMVRRLRGRAALQRFFTSPGRAFCLYMVLEIGSRTRLPARPADAVLGTLAIAPGGG